MTVRNGPAPNRQVVLVLAIREGQAVTRISQSIAAILGILFSLSTEASDSQWQRHKHNDPFTDEVTIVASTEGVENSSQSTIVRCKGTKFDTYVNFGGSLGDDFVHIRYRLDKTKPVSERWLTSDDGTSAFADKEMHLARLLMDGNTFIIEARGARGSTHLASFSLTGSSSAIGSVMEHCGVSRVGMHQRVNGLRLDMALELEIWGPKGISVRKRILSSMGKYEGSLDNAIESKFALAVQDLYDEFMEQCRQRRGPAMSTTSCSTFHTLIDGRRKLGMKVDESIMDLVTPDAASVIYQLAPEGSLKKEAGNLKYRD